MNRTRHRLAVALRRLANRLDPVPSPLPRAALADVIAWHIGYIIGRYGP